MLGVWAALVLVLLPDFSYGTVHAKDAPHPPSLLQTAAMQMLAGGLVVTLLGSAVGNGHTAPTIIGAAAGALIGRSVAHHQVHCR